MTTQREGGLGFAPGHEPMLPAGFRSSSRILVWKQMKVRSRLPAKSEKIVGRSNNKPWDAQGSQCTKTKIVYFENAFHGRSMGALSVTTNPKYQVPFEPLLPEVSCGKLEAYCGIHPAETEWLTQLRKRCDQVGAVLIFDEIKATSNMNFKLGISVVWSLSHWYTMGSLIASC